MYIPRALEPVIRRYSEHFKVVMVTGPRQVGKTTMLEHLSAEDAEHGRHRHYVSMDDTAMRAAAVEDPALFLQRFDPPVLIDEIQKAPELLPYIKLIVDGSEDKGQFWLTGSQPFHLMKHVSESLAGRVAIVEMLGLSNAEMDGTASEPFMPQPDYYKRRVAEAKPLSVTEAFERIASGSLPGIQQLPADLRSEAYESYFDTYIMRDIRDLSQVADELKFRRFVSACAALTSKPVVYAELARIAEVDVKTAKAWLSLLVSSYLVKIVPPYANNLIKRLSKQPIMHFTDTGLAVHLTGWTNARALELGPMSGQIFETYAYGEIAKSYVNAGMKPPLHFFRTNDRKEIDLLLERDNMLYPVEVKKSANPSARDIRNFAALAPLNGDVPDGLSALKREIGCGTLLSMTSETYPIADDAWCFPVWAV